MLVALCSDKGSPGSTTTALVLASAWPGPALVVEADPAGGDLGLRLRDAIGAAFPVTPTVLTVGAAAATAARASHLGGVATGMTAGLDGSSDPVDDHSHRFTDGVSVIPGAVGAEESAGFGDWAPLGAALAAHPGAVFVDLGRLHRASPVMALAAHADVLVALGRPDPSSVMRLRMRLSRLASELAALGGGPPRLFPVLIAPPRYGPGHLVDLRHLMAATPAGPFLVGSGFVSYDPAAVARLESAEDPTGRLARTTLMRSAHAVTGALAGVGESRRATTPSAAVSRFSNAAAIAGTAEAPPRAATTANAPAPDLSSGTAAHVKAIGRGTP